jgi:hypothetical protein
MAEDPIGFEGRGYNFFIYCKNDPVNFIDITGTTWYGEYLGPHEPGDANPFSNIQPIDKVDAAAKKHDQGYATQGASGVEGVLTNIDVWPYDLKLSKDAMCSIGKNKSFTGDLWAVGATAFFGGIGVMKAVVDMVLP